MSKGKKEDIREDSGLDEKGLNELIFSIDSNPVEKRGKPEKRKHDGKSGVSNKVAARGKAGTGMAGKRQEGGEKPAAAGKRAKTPAAGMELANKRKKGTSRKDLFDLITKKNRMLQDMKKTIGGKEQELEKKEDRLLRLAAEFENYRKRTRREWELHQKRAIAGLILNILGVLDDFERAIETAGGKTDDHFHAGVRMIYSSMIAVLQKEGLHEIEAEKMVFDPQYHEAVSEIESDEVEEGTIAHVVQKGYMLHDQLLRPAKVVVAKKR